MSVLEVTHDGAVAVLTLNRPERRNALSGDLVDALAAALRAADADPAVHAVVIAANGPTFCAGGDLKGGLAGDGFLAGHAQRGAYADLLALMPKLGVPLVAAVDGDAMGGGFGLAAGCDVVVAGDTARFGTPEIKLGLFPWIILAVLQRDVPRKRLLELVLTGEKLSAAAACDLGVVTRVVPAGTALRAAMETAGVIASRSPAIVAMGKRAFHHIADQPLEDALRFMHGQLSINLLTDDAAEGIAAFLQKRPPEWKGR